MKNFNDIQNQWTNQITPQPSENSIENIEKKSNLILRKQLLTQFILGFTVVVLISFFFYISAYRLSQTFWGLSIMILSLVIRIILEYFSRLKKGKLPIFDDMKSFNQKLITYYNQRKIIHFLLTPILFVSYIIGFLMLLPAFEANLSAGFYTYIHWSSVFVFLFLAALISFQIKKELFNLKQLKNER